MCFNWDGKSQCDCFCRIIAHVPRAEPFSFKFAILKNEWPDPNLLRKCLMLGEEWNLHDNENKCKIVNFWQTDLKLEVQQENIAIPETDQLDVTFKENDEYSDIGFLDTI